MAGLRSVFDDPEVLHAPAPVFEGPTVIGTGSPGAIERGFRSADLGGQANALLWKQQEALAAGDVRTAAALDAQVKALQQQAQVVNPNARQLTDFLPSGEASISELPSYIGEQLGSGLQSASQITPAGVAGSVAGLGAAALTRGRFNPLKAAGYGGLAGATIPSYNMNAEETLGQLVADPTIAATTTPEERLSTARTTGAGMAALDLAPLGLVAGRLGNAFTREGLKNATLRGALTDFAGGTATEALTGAGQAAMQQVAQQKLNPEHEFNTQDVINSAAAEAIGGAPMHGAQAAANYAMGKPVGVVGDFVNETVVPGAKKAYDVAKRGAGKTADAVGELDGLLKASADAALNAKNDLAAAREIDPNVSAMDVVAANATDAAKSLYSSAKEKLKGFANEHSDAFIEGLKHAEKRLGEMGFAEPGAKETKDFLEAVANAPDGQAAKTLFDNMNEGVRGKIARYTRLARETAEKQASRMKNDPAAQTTSNDDPYGLGNASLQGVGSKDVVNKAARSAVEEIKKNVRDANGFHSLLDNIANRITSGSVMFRGRSNVSESIRRAISGALESTDNEALADQFSQRDLYNKLYEVVKNKVEAPVQDAFDKSGFKEMARSGVRDMLTPVIKGLYFEDNLSEQETDQLAEQYSSLLSMLSEGPSGDKADKFASLMIDKFGADRAEPAIEAMQQIANSIYGDGRGPNAVNALQRTRSVANIAGELRKHLNEKENASPSVIPRLKEMLGNFKKVESAVVAGQMSRDAGNAVLKGAWAPFLKDGTSFERVLPILEAYEKNPDKIDTTTIGRDNAKLASGGGSIAHANREGEFSGDDQQADEVDSDPENKTDVAAQYDIDPDKKKAADKRNNETGQQGNKQAPLYYGHHSVVGKQTKEGDVQAPVDTYPGQDYPHGANNLSGTEFGLAVENVFASASHRLADVKRLRPLAWADEVSEATGQDYHELLNKSMDALLAHDQTRAAKLKKIDGASESVDVIETRAKLAQRMKEMYGVRAGEAFYSHPLNKNYRYLRTEQGDASNIALSAEQLSWMGPRKGETNAAYDLRMSNGIKARADLVAESRVGVAVKGEEVPMEVDLARVVMSMINYHQQADISSVTRGFKDAHVDPLGSEKDTERALAGHQDFGKALLDALHNTITSIYLAEGVETNAKEIIQGLTPETVIYRDFESGRIIRYGMLRKFKGYENIKNSPWALSDKDIAQIVLPINSKLGSEMVAGKRVLRAGEIVTEGAVRNPRLVEAADRNAQRGVAMRAVTKDGKTFDLNVHALLNNMLEQYGIDPNFANHEEVMSKELAAFLLLEGVKKMQRAGYAVDLNRVGDEGSVQSFYPKVVVFKGRGEGDSRYGITLGDLKKQMDTFEKSGKKLAVDFKSSQDAASKAKLKLVEKLLTDADKLAKLGKADPAFELKRAEVEARRDKLIEDVSWATGVPVEKIGDVGDGQIDIAHEHAAGPSGIYTPLAKQSRLKSEHGGYSIEGKLGREADDTTDSSLPKNRLKVDTSSTFNAKERADLNKPLEDSISEEDFNAGVERTRQQLNDQWTDEQRAAGAVPGARKGTTAPMVKGRITETSTNARERQMQRERNEAMVQAKQWLAKRNERAERMAQRKADATVEAENARMLAEQAAAAEKSLAAAVEQSLQNKKERNRVEIISEPSDGNDSQSFEDWVKSIDASFSKQGVKNTDPKSAEHFAAIHEMLTTELRRLLGKLVGDVKLVDTKSFAGMSPKDSNDILVALGALDHLGVLHHEAWHQVERMLKALGPQGEAVLQKIYDHVNKPEMVEALRKYYNDEGVSGQLDSVDPLTASQERAAFAFQLFMREKKLPLAPATRSKFQAIKDFVKKMLAKIGVEFSNDNDQVEAFFNYINTGGFLRDNTNPEAMVRALKQKNGDKALANARAVVKPIQEAFDVVFGHTAERLKSANIAAYNKAIELYVGKDGKSGYLGKKRMRMNQFGNEIGAILAGMTEDERANFATQPKFKAFMERFKSYMISRGMEEADANRIISNMTVFDQDLIDANFKEFYDDLTKYGGLKDMEAGDIRSIAQQIADKGYIPSDIKLFPEHAEIRRKWENFDAKDYMARLITLGVEKAERQNAFGKDDVRLKELRAQGDEQAAGDVKKLAQNVFDALDGNYQQSSLSPRMKRITQMLITVNNIRLLPFAVFSQAIEPLQIALRANKQMSALDTMWRGVKEMPRTFDAINKKMYSKDFWEKFGEQAGTVSAEIMGDVIGQQYNGMDLHGVSKKVNDIFFKYNFMQQWDRSMRIAATKQASYFLLDHANELKEGTSAKDKDGGLRSERFLKELGLTKDDVYKNIRKDEETGEFYVNLDDEKIQAAVTQFVEEALAHPDVGSNPLWANDVRFALLAHMKRFSFAQARYVLGRIGNELTNGNYAVLSPVLLAVPWMLLSDMFKDIVKPGDEAYKANWDFTDYLLQGIDRAGLGRAAIPLDAIKAQSHGGNAVEGALGPTAELFGKTIRGIGNFSREKASAE